MPELTMPSSKKGDKNLKPDEVIDDEDIYYKLPENS
ncbi:hypothetical protein V12G01_08350 [Vibrio alginolyticus 12G01]|nr:hypothetical protein V12G01_08350 [Vibrio alginolyticus 12G01]